MKKRMLLMICIFPFYNFANPCVVKGSIDVEIESIMVNKLHIDKKNIKDLKIELLSDTPVSPKMAKTLAKEKIKKSPYLTKNDLIRIYHENHVRNLIVKLTYSNNKSKVNTFIISSLVNDNECSVDFIGHLIVEKTF